MRISGAAMRGERVSQQGDDVHCAVVTTDNKRVCVASGSQVAIHEASSGRREHVFTEKSRVVGMASSYDSADKLIVYLVSGMRIEYSLSTNTVVECRDIHQSPLLAVYEDTRTQTAYTLTPCAHETSSAVIDDDLKGKVDVNRVTLEEDGSQRVENLMRKDCSFKVPRLNSLGQLTLSDKLVAVCEGVRVRAYVFESGSVREYRFTGSDQYDGIPCSFVSVRAFQGVSLVATLSFGRVMVWNDVTQHMGTPSQCVHWHRLSPSVVLTPQGAVVSGGVEGVVVKYAAKGSRTGSMADSFLSRLGAAISRMDISEDGSLLSVVLADGSVVVALLSTMTVLSRLETLQHPFVCTRHFDLTTDPLKPGLVVHNGRPGCIQWINPCTMLTTAVLDVVSQNAPEVVRTNPLLLAPHMDVTAVALNREYMMTCEERFGDEISVHVLKFWQRDPVLMATMQFSTLCENAVRFARACDSANDLFVSIDEANKLRVWQKGEPREDEQVVWMPTQIAAWKDAPVVAASTICESRLATVHRWDGDRSTLVVWRITRGEPITQLLHHDVASSLKAVQWCASPHQHLLLACSTTQVLAIDTCAMLVKWSALHEGLSLGACLGDAIAYDDSQLIVFDGESGEETRRVPLEDRPTSVLGVDRSAMLVAHAHSYTAFVSESAQSAEKMDTRNDAKTPFAHLANRRKADGATPSQNPTGRVTLEGSSALNLLKGPSHSIAPVPKIALPFIESCLLPALSVDAAE